MRIAVEGHAVAKKKPAKPVPKKSDPEGLAVVLVMKGRPEWKEWLKRLARARHMSVAVLVDQALMAYAQSCGHDEAPPERTE